MYSVLNWASANMSCTLVFTRCGDAVGEDGAQGAGALLAQGLRGVPIPPFCEPREAVDGVRISRPPRSDAPAFPPPPLLLLRLSPDMGALFGETGMLFVPERMWLPY